MPEKRKPGVFDLVVTGGTVVTSSWQGPATIGILNGRIAALMDPETEVDARESFDAGGKTVLPALVDTHVHLRDPGHPDKEDFYTGTCAAAAGGYGTVIAQPNTAPPATDPTGVSRILEIGHQRSIVDYGVSALVTPDNIDGIADLKAAGANTLDIASCDVPETWMMTLGKNFVRALAEARRLELPLAIYATDASVVAARTEALIKSGRKDPLAWAEARPGFSEAAEVARVAVLVRESGAKALFRQITAAESVECLARLKPSTRISVEVNPHHLFLSENDLVQRGPWAKMAPPLRRLSDVDALWSGLFQGSVDMVGGDHAPHSAEEKAVGTDDIWKAASGVPTLETALPLFLTEVANGRISTRQIALWMAERPARWLGVFPRKGTIAVGSDADLVVLDLHKEWEIKGSSFLGKAKWTPFEGRRCKGAVEATMVRGRWVYRSGSIVGKPGWGQAISPSN